MTEIEKAKKAISIIMGNSGTGAFEVALIAIAHALIAIAEQLETGSAQQKNEAVAGWRRFRISHPVRKS